MPSAALQTSVPRSITLDTSLGVDTSVGFAISFGANAADGSVITADLVHVRLRPEDENPRAVFLRDSVGEGWIVKNSPLQIWVAPSENGSFIATHALVSIYGIGNSQKDAVDDFIATLLDCYESLEEDADRDEAVARQFASFKNSLIDRSLA